jgi:general secretion pathway protein K
MLAKKCVSRTDDHGFIIVAVLWILAALATLAMIYSLYARTMAVNFPAHNERLQAQALAQSGVELAAYQLTAQPNQQPLQGDFSFRQGSAVIAVKFRCENSFIDLNFAPEAMLARLFVSFGVQPEDAQAYADRIIAWRTPLRAGTSDSETALYEAVGKDYGPRHGPFQSKNELGSVASVPPALVDSVLPYVTVYSGGAQVNVFAAPSRVLAALPGLTAEGLAVLLTMRGNGPQDVIRAQLGTALAYVTLNPSRANRVTVDVRQPSGRRTRAEAVIFPLPQDSEPYRVLSWRDDVPLGDEDYGVVAR